MLLFGSRVAGFELLSISHLPSENIIIIIVRRWLFPAFPWSVRPSSSKDIASRTIISMTVRVGLLCWTPLGANW